MANAGVTELVAATVEAGAPAAEARNWWLGYLLQQANAAAVEPADLADQPGAGRPGGGAGRPRARSAPRWPVRSLDGVLAGEGEPDAVVEARGLKVVSDTGALAAAVADAIAAQPDAAQKVRDGKVAAVGALVGAVMKATRGQADAAVVKDLLLAELGQA